MLSGDVARPGSNPVFCFAHAPKPIDTEVAIRDREWRERWPAQQGPAVGFCVGLRRPASACVGHVTLCSVSAPTTNTEQLRRQLEDDAAEWHKRAGQGGDVGLLDKGQLSELATWLTPDTRRDLGVSEVAKSFIAASRAATRRRWWPGRTATGTVLAILLMLLILATPIILLFIVVLTASVIHALG